MKDVEVFFDTNIIVYHYSDVDVDKQRRAAEILTPHVERRTGAVSAQVMQECLHVLTGKIKASVDTAELYAAQVLRPLYRIDTTAELIDSAMEVKRRWRFSFYDSLVIAAALACDAKTLYSEDLQHGQKIEKLTIVNPFL